MFSSKLGSSSTTTPLFHQKICNIQYHLPALKKEYYHTSLDIHIFFTGINIINYRVPLELVGLMATSYEPHTRLSEVANPRPDFKSGMNIVSCVLLI